MTRGLSDVALHMTKTEIEQLLASLRIPFAIVANVSTGSIERFGDPSAIHPADLIDELFGDADDVRELHESFVGRLKPQSMGQGDVAAVLCTPKPDVIVGLFSKVILGPVEYYQWTKGLCAAVDSAWK